MTAVTVEEAQARLPELIEKVAAGEKVVITCDDRPVAELAIRSPDLAADDENGAAGNDGPARSEFGCCKGMVTFIADDFDAPLEDFKDYM